MDRPRRSDVITESRELALHSIAPPTCCRIAFDLQQSGRLTLAIFRHSHQQLERVQDLVLNLFLTTPTPPCRAQTPTGDLLHIRSLRTETRESVLSPPWAEPMQPCSGPPSTSAQLRWKETFLALDVYRSLPNSWPHKTNPRCGAARWLTEEVVADWPRLN
jgi:hypothetical protein